MLQNRLARLFPYIFLISGLLAVIQFAAVVRGFLRKSGAGTWYLAHAQLVGYALAVLAATAWIVLLAGWLRRHDRLPKSFTRWTLMMDILDRLTNRQDLERRLSEKVETVFGGCRRSR